jgi:hypothetical protein
MIDASLVVNVDLDIPRRRSNLLQEGPQPVGLLDGEACSFHYPLCQVAVTHLLAWLLDSGASIHLVDNLELLHNQRFISRPSPYTWPLAMQLEGLWPHVHVHDPYA